MIKFVTTRRKTGNTYELSSPSSPSSLWTILSLLTGFCVISVICLGWTLTKMEKQSSNTYQNDYQYRRRHKEKRDKPNDVDNMTIGLQISVPSIVAATTTTTTTGTTKKAPAVEHWTRFHQRTGPKNNSSIIIGHSDNDQIKIWNNSPVSLEDIRQFYDNQNIPKNPSRVNDKSCYHAISSWDDAQRCINGPRYVYGDGTVNPFISKMKNNAVNDTGKDNNMTAIRLVGERNSGTKFVMQQLQQCFPYNEFGIKIFRDFARPKHFFQPVPTPTPSKNRLRRHNSNIIIATFRDPIEWVAAMIELPYHAPYHMDGLVRIDDGKGGYQYRPKSLSWEEFVHRPWSLPHRPQSDMGIDTDNWLCTFYFRYHHVMPCKKNELHFDIYDKHNTSQNVPVENNLPSSIERAYFPVYELRRNSTIESGGIPYSNILELRNDKIINFLLEIGLIYQLGGYLAIRYEDLIVHGTRTTLEEVATMIGLSSLPKNCKPSKPQLWRIGKRNISEGLRNWVEENMNINIEKLLGYSYDFDSVQKTQ